METLWKIDERLNNLLEVENNMYVDPETGEIVDIESLKMDKKEKITNIIKAIKNLKDDYESLKKAGEDLKKRADAKEEKIKWLKNYLASHMEKGEKFECVAGAIRWHSGESVVIDCKPEELPKEYITTKITVDKTRLKAAIKSGEEIKGAHIERSTSISVR